MQSQTKTKPLALFDSLEHFEYRPALLEPDSIIYADHKKAYEFLKSYTGSKDTFNAYRREVERLLQWCLLVALKPLKELKRDDLEEYIYFCQKPPRSWIGKKIIPRFIVKDAERIQNTAWRPFVATISKAAHRIGESPDTKKFELSHKAVKLIFTILSSFYNYLLQDEYLFVNPIALIRQKNKFIRKHQSPPKIRRLSELQWQTVIQTAREMAEQNPELHERTYFIMSALYSMYLRISELAASSRWTPSMNHFYKDSDSNWWFKTVGKGNKERDIAVSNAMLAALKRWRKYLGLSTLPSPADQSPLLPKIKGNGPMADIRYIRSIVQGCFDASIEKLKKEKHDEEAETLIEATVHWLRHTGISEDVQHRPREHVRDDAGHSSSAITDKYIDIERKERHRSAKNKIFE